MRASSLLLAGAVSMMLLANAVPSALASSSSSANSSSTSSANNVTVTVTDGHDRINPGGDLVYAVTVQESTTPSQTVDVSLSLPSYVNTATPSDNAKQVGNLILWSAVTLTQNQPKVFTVHISLLPNIPDNTQLLATAQAGNSQSTDTTVVLSGTTSSQPFAVSLTDNQSSVHPGDTLTYMLTVTNTAAFAQHADVHMTASNLVAIDTISPTTTYSYPNIDWKNMSFNANEQKTFTVTVDVQKRLTAYTSIRTTASANGVSASDTDSVVPINVSLSSSSSSSSNSSSSSSTSSSQSVSGRSVLFRSVADSSEVVPGGTIRYTLYVQNILLNVIHAATVDVRFDPAQVSVVDSAGAASTENGQLQWTLPTLQPGQIWRTTYAMKVGPAVANDTQISNVATINGSDVGTASLDERVTVSTSNVVTNLPTTGAAYDILFVLAVLPIAFLLALTQKKAQ